MHICKKKGNFALFFLNRVMKKLLFLTFLMMPLCGFATSHGFFMYTPYGESLYADMHPNFVRVEFAFHTNHPAYDYAATTNKMRWTTLGLFGFNLPVWRGDFDNHRFGVSVTETLSAHLWLDLFEPQTAPVINTDYRIAAPTVTFLHRLNKGFAQNYSIAWSPFKHESTHIGDELQLSHVDAAYPLRRVNVSYNYTELVFTFNEPEQRLDACHTFRAGLMLLLSPRDGWYSVKPADGEESFVQPRLSPWEAYLQYQYQSPASKHGFQAVVSAEVRNRALYGYTYNGVGTQPEKRVFTYNVFVGARYNTPNYSGYFSRFIVGLRAYHGNCPYGQFRDINNYNQLSLSIIFQ